jgi:hypothetical protein
LEKWQTSFTLAFTGVPETIPRDRKKAMAKLSTRGLTLNHTEVVLGYGRNLNHSEVRLRRALTHNHSEYALSRRGSSGR